jgi:hypothetical protein
MVTIAELRGSGPIPRQTRVGRDEMLDEEGLRRCFSLAFRCRFVSFDSDYPLCVSTANGAFQCHGLGPAYGASRRGKMTFYVYT